MALVRNSNILTFSGKKGSVGRGEEEDKGWDNNAQ